MMKKVVVGSLAASMLLCGVAQAHFQLLYTPEVNLEKPGNIPVKLIFWHPMENGHAMDMDKPQEFYYQLKDNKVDLLGSLKEFTFNAKDNKSKGFETSVEVKRNGDYIFVLTPAPYFEKSEDVYIQQITKAFVNKGEIPTGWEEPLGLKTEIVPFVRPTNVMTGSTFTGQVLGDGKPVANAEIEVEYIAAEPDVKTNRPGKEKSGPAAGGGLVVYADENGMFTFGIPKAGFWGFAALGSGPDKEFKGKELSQDAVIWIRAYDFK